MNGILQDTQTAKNHIRGDIRRGKYRFNYETMPTANPAAGTSTLMVPLPNNSKGKGKEKPGSGASSPATVPPSTTSSAGSIPIHPVVLHSRTPPKDVSDRLNYDESTLPTHQYPSYGAEMPPDLASSESIFIDPILSTNTYHPNSTPFHSEFQEMEIDALASGGVPPSAITDTPVPWNHNSPSQLPAHFLEETGMVNEEDFTWSHNEEVYEETMPGYIGTEEQDTEHTSFTEDMMHSTHNIMYQFKPAQPVSPGEVYQTFHKQHWVCILLLCILYLHTHCKLGHAPIRKLLVTLRWVFLFALRILPLDDPFPISLATLLKKVEPLTHYIRMPLCPRCHTFAPLDHQSLTPESQCLACGTALACGADGEAETHTASSSSRRTRQVKPRLQAPHRPLTYYLSDMLQEPGIEQELEDFMQGTSNPNILSSVQDGRICQNLKAHDGTPFFGKADHTDLSIGVVMHYDGCVVLNLIDFLLTRSQVSAASRPVFWVSYIRCTFLCICWVGNREKVLSETQYNA